MTAIQFAFFDLLPVISIIFGLLFGSFLSVCIYRLPLGRTKGLASLEESDERSTTAEQSTAGCCSSASTSSSASSSKSVSFFYPARSFCPHCNNMLKWWMNIPVLSWLFLMGRCYYCKSSISWRYPLVEVLSAIFCFLSFTFFPFTTALLVYCFCAAMIVVSFIDLDYYIIPNAITFPGMLIAIVLAVANHFTHFLAFPFVEDLQSAGLGLLFGGGFLWLVSALYRVIRRRDGLGFGDVKLMALVGLLFGPQAAIIAIFAGSTLGTFVGVIYIFLSRATFSRPLPFGPFLAIGSILYIFFSPSLYFLQEMFLFF